METVRYTSDNENIAKDELKVGYITYDTLDKRIDGSIICNAMSERLYETMDLYSGENEQYFDDDWNIIDRDNFDSDESYQEARNNTENTEYIDVYQYYIISQWGAEYLSHMTNEIVYYDNELDLYVWGITHCGTSWTGVYTDIKIDEKYRKERAEALGVELK